MNNLQYRLTAINTLIPYAKNPRKNDAVIERMCAAIREFGFRIPIVARSDGTVVDGHLRLKAAQALGMIEVPVVLADDLTEVQIKAFRLLANQSANWAQWDEDLLKVELENLKALDFDLDLTGFDTEEIDRLLDLKVNTLDSVDAAVGLNDSGPVISKPGDLWLLGKHRLHCGDSTKAESYQIVLDGKAADMTFCDPPYNVNYEADAIASQRSNRVLNDNLGNDFAEFLQQACTHIVNNTSGAIYICMAGSELHTLQKAFKEAGGHWSTFIVWAKQHFALGRADYHRQYEPILYGWKTGADHYWCGDRDQSDLWCYDMAFSNKLHPTMKPVGLMERAITNSSKLGNTVLDPFGGSGTTLIACENLGRYCRMIELDPHYVDTIIRRWQDHTGQNAVLERTGETFNQLNLHGD